MSDSETELLHGRRAVRLWLHVARFASCRAELARLRELDRILRASRG